MQELSGKIATIEVSIQKGMAEYQAILTQERALQEELAALEQEKVSRLRPIPTL